MFCHYDFSCLSFNSTSKCPSGRHCLQPSKLTPVLTSPRDPQLCLNNTVEDVGLVTFSSLGMVEMEIHTLLKEAPRWASGCRKEGNLKIQNKTRSYKTSTLLQVSGAVGAWRMLCCLNRPLLAPPFPEKTGLERCYSWHKYTIRSGWIPPKTHTTKSPGNTFLPRRRSHAVELVNSRNTRKEKALFVWWPLAGD